MDSTPEQQRLWARVEELWALAAGQGGGRSGEREADRAGPPDEDAIRRTIHPRYRGWPWDAPEPHDRDAAVASVGTAAPAIREYALTPRSVEVYERATGVAHYSYTAVVVPPDGEPRRVDGRWTEVYADRDGEWLLVAVSGGPER